MNTFKYFSGIIFSFGFFFLPVSTYAADSESCRTAWSQAFDAVSAHLIENETDGLSVFLTQNHIAQADMWAAYRAITMRHRCYLNTVCAAVNLGGNFETGKVFSPSNVLGGGVPGAAAVCFPEETVGDILTPLSGKYGFDPTTLQSCNFVGSTSPEEELDLRLFMYATCTAHVDIMSEIFERTVRNLIMADSERKTAGYFASQVTALVKGIQESQEAAGKFVSHFNSVMGRICTLAYPD